MKSTFKTFRKNKSTYVTPLKGIVPNVFEIFWQYQFVKLRTDIKAAQNLHRRRQNHTFKNRTVVASKSCTIYYRGFNYELLQSLTFMK